MAGLNETRIGALLREPFGATCTRTAAAGEHVEHGVALLVGVDGDLDLTAATAAGEVRIRARAVLVPADTAFAARCPAPVVSFTFDPELCPRVAGRARAAGRPVAVDDPRVTGAIVAARGTLPRPGVLAGLGSELATVLATGTAVRVDRRVARLLEALRDPSTAPLDRAAALAGTRLSPAHVRALFARDVGMTISGYLLWRRLLHGLARVGPLDLTGAAHAAGFADLAHFSRTCRRLLGYAPSALRANLLTT
jgi:AraC-like DNA-binding protein